MACAEEPVAAALLFIQQLRPAVHIHRYGETLPTRITEPRRVHPVLGPVLLNRQRGPQQRAAGDGIVPTHRDALQREQGEARPGVVRLGRHLARDLWHALARLAPRRPQQLNGVLQTLNAFHQALDTRAGSAAKRLRPKFMTVATTFIGFFPIMLATGTGSDVWKRIAAPMIGGILTSFVLELVVYPAIYEIWKWHFEVKGQVRDTVETVS